MYAPVQGAASGASLPSIGSQQQLYQQQQQQQRPQHPLPVAPGAANGGSGGYPYPASPGMPVPTQATGYPPGVGGYPPPSPLPNVMGAPVLMPNPTGGAPMAAPQYMQHQHQHQQEQQHQQSHSVTAGPNGASSTMTTTTTGASSSQAYAMTTYGLPNAPMAAHAAPLLAAAEDAKPLTLHRASHQPNPVTVDTPMELFREAGLRLPTGSPAEAAKIRYTAVTGEPEEFHRNYNLLHTQNGQKIELMIVVTMYNEDPRLFTKTMRAIHDNIRQMMQEDPANWPADSWKKIMVCIVSDGRTKIHPGVVTLLAMMGAYRDGLIRTALPNPAGPYNAQGDANEDIPTSAHVFETTVVRNFDGTPEKGVDIVDNHTSRERQIVPMQTLFCLKEKNAKKINSHRWFFKAFCKMAKPNVTLLIDVGTQPQKLSIWRLWRMFLDPQVGGACGEIAVEGDFWSKLNPIIAGQNFEYKMSNILDKPIESLAGYITVLPGAFSAYRYEALQGRPLQEYFKGEVIEKEGGLFERNMYLAEDRILCFELVTKEDAPWVLRYDKQSVAVTDAPDDFAELIPQRRRWLNGSTFALLYALMHASRIWSSGHSFVRRIVLSFEFVYLLLNFLFGFFSLSNFYFSFQYLVSSYVTMINRDKGDWADSTYGARYIPGPWSGAWQSFFTIFLDIMQPFYVLLVIMTFIASLGNSPKSSRPIFMGIIYGFALLSFVMFIIIILSTVQQINEAGGFSFVVNHLNDVDGAVVWTFLAIMSTWGLYILSSLIFADVYHSIFNVFQYVALTPFYVNVLQIFAYSNISETGWGTKGSDEVHIAGSGGTAAAPKVVLMDGVPMRDLSKLPFLDDKAFVADRDKEWQALVALMRKEPVAPKGKKDQLDVFKKFRTYFLLMYILVNGLLLLILMSPKSVGIVNANLNGDDLNKAGEKFRAQYLNVLFKVVLGLSGFRFFFSTLYRVLNLVS
ncbi:chitin synthase-domain-containing protein [Blastocladiella britannica]|nr:chitin synthase-domain-containing protein [Blastocladiella britannica]